MNYLLSKLDRWCQISQIEHWPTHISETATDITKIAILFSTTVTQGSHQKFEQEFPDFSPDFSLTSKEIFLTILSTTDCRSISYVNISDKSQCLK